MYGYLKINRLRIDTLIGIYDWEQTQKQPLYLDLELAIDVLKAAESGQIADALDYQQLAQELTELVATNKMQLIESVAKTVVDYLQDRYQLSYGKVQVSKPRALSSAEEVAVVIEFGHRP